MSTSPASRPRLLDIKEAAAYLGIPVRKLRGARERREVPVVLWGKRIYFRREDLDKLVEAHYEPAIRGPLAPVKVRPTHPASRRSPA